MTSERSSTDPLRHTSSHCLQPSLHHHALLPPCIKPITNSIRELSLDPSCRMSSKAWLNPIWTASATLPSSTFLITSSKTLSKDLPHTKPVLTISNQTIFPNPCILILYSTLIPINLRDCQTFSQIISRLELLYFLTESAFTQLASLSLK